MPLNQSPVTYFALNAANDTSPSAVTDAVTGQPLYISDLDIGVYFDLTCDEAIAMSNTTTGTLCSGRYRRVKVDSGATAANVKTGTIGLMPSLAVQGSKITMNTVTSADQSLAASTLRPVVFLNTVTPGNYCFVQELGVATVLPGSSFTGTAAAGVCVDVVQGTGVVTIPSGGTPTTNTIGKSLEVPIPSTKFRVLLNLPVVQD
jgi:hypothetical protein